MSGGSGGVSGGVSEGAASAGGECDNDVRPAADEAEGSGGRDGGCGQTGGDGDGADRADGRGEYELSPCSVHLPTPPPT